MLLNLYTHHTDNNRIWLVIGLKLLWLNILQYSSHRQNVVVILLLSELLWLKWWEWSKLDYTHHFDWHAPAYHTGRYHMWNIQYIRSGGSFWVTLQYISFSEACVRISWIDAICKDIQKVLQVILTHGGYIVSSIFWSGNRSSHGGTLWWPFCGQTHLHFMSDNP